jgi:hypothetical protein
VAQNTNIGIGLILSAKNQASAALDSFFNRTKGQMKDLGRSAADVGKGIAEILAARKGVDMLKATTDAFGEMEAAGNMLKANLMGKGGAFDTGMYEKLFQYSKKVSAANTGSTASYLDMIRVMKQNRIAPKDILGGIGSDAAMLAHYFNNMLPASTAEFAAHMKNDMAVATKDMYKVMDLTARIHDVGVGKTGEEAVTEMNQFFSKVGLGMAGLHATGIEEAKKMGALGAIFMARGISGQSVGTNFRRMLDSMASGEKVKKMNEVAGMFRKHLDFFDSKGKFLGIDNFVTQIGKLQGMNPAAVEAILKPFGGKQGLETDFIRFLANEGLSAYPEMVKRIENQASLREKVGAIMEGQKLQEAVLASNVTNTKASFGAAISAPYKSLLATLNRVTVAVGAFFDNHQKISKATAGIIAFASAGLALGGVLTVMRGLGAAMKLLGVVGPLANIMGLLRGVSFAAFAVRFHFITGLLPALSKVGVAFRALGAVLLANPIGLIIVGVVALAAVTYLVIRNWSSVKAFFSSMWDHITNAFHVAGQFIKSAILAITPHWMLAAWAPVKAFFGALWGGVSAVVSGGVSAVSWAIMHLTPVGLIYKYWMPIAHFFKGLWDLVSTVTKAGVFLIARALYRFTGAELVVKYWQPIRGFFAGMWDGIKMVFGAGVSAVGFILKNFTPVGLIYKYWQPMSGFFRGMWNGVKNVFTGVFHWVWNFGGTFVKAGMHIIDSITAGIFSKIGQVGDAMSKVAAKIRAYLPFSPAKEGALRDINNIRLIETIAASINGDPLVRAVAAVMKQVHSTIRQFGNVAMTVRPRILPVMAGLGLMAGQASAGQPKGITSKNGMPSIGVHVIKTQMETQGITSLPGMMAANGARSGNAWGAGATAAINETLKRTAAVRNMDVHGKIGFESIGERQRNLFKTLGPAGSQTEGGRPASPAASAAKGGKMFEFNVTIQLNGSATPKDAKLVSDELERRMESWYNKKVANMKRVSY